jgi:serine/threonine protein kinase
VLGYLHNQKQPIIFRDVKPANIMRTSKGRLYLIDFGIARHFTPGQTKDTGPLGSPGYAAPEQYGKAQTTVQTDIYGLGATLQTLLTGVDPLDALTGATSSIPTRHIPKKFQRLLNQMLEPDASKRPQSMDEVKRHLQQIKWGIARYILTTIRRILPFFWGLLIGSMPYSLIISLLFLAILSSHHHDTADSASLLFLPLIALLCTWPFVFISQLTAGIRFLFSPHKRLMGLGILAMQVFLIIGMTLGWIPSPFPYFLPL